jgi:DMSO/TMAO reductase YedYZ heme-binding membrane subunit
MVTLHPVIFAISKMDISVFIPDFSSWISFWELAGRPALILIYVATIAAILRKRIQKYWRVFHVLNYIALLFVYIHGVLIGTDFQNLGILILSSAMLIFSFSSFALKRYQNYSRKKRIKKRREVNKE